ncbi:MAG: SPOR domain-containing protein [Schleiferiaceae bacterium]|jgi:hypothetical protein|nr:SPOR domain-containing protein [Schleiferiaceae bacterium]
MKYFRSICFLFFLFGSYQSSGQNNWLFYTSVEESFVIGDQNASFNPFVISNAVNNSGIRLGAILEINDKLCFESTLGVIGSAKLNGFTTKLVPVEVLGHYEITTFGEIDNLPLQLNGNIGFGVALARAQSDNFNTAGTSGLAENFTLGASLDIIEIDNHLLGIGYRHTIFTDDYLDASIIEGGRDQLSRFFAYAKIDFKSKSDKLKAQIAEKNYEINQLKSQLIKQIKSGVGEEISEEKADLNVASKTEEGNGLLESFNVEDNKIISESVNARSEQNEIESVSPMIIHPELSDLNPSRFDATDITDNEKQSGATKNNAQNSEEHSIMSAPSVTEEEEEGLQNKYLDNTEFTKPFSAIRQKPDNITRKYAIVVGTFDNIEEAEKYIKKVPGGKAFTTEVGPLGKFRVIYGLYPSVNEEVLYRLEELRFYGFKPWVTKI